MAGGVVAASSTFAGGRGDGDGDLSAGGGDGLDGLRKMSAKASSFERMLWKIGAKPQGLKRGTMDGRKRVEAEVGLDVSEDGPDGREKIWVLHRKYFEGHLHEMFKHSHVMIYLFILLTCSP